MHILLITTHNLATNPRLVKELRLFINHGYKVTVICFDFNNWSKVLNNQIKEKFPTVRFIIINANRKPFFPWFINNIVQQLAKLLLYISPNNSKLISYAYFKNSYRIKRIFNGIRENFDWVIAHNPGSFWVAKIYAQKHGIKLGIDMEDYHPGEVKKYIIANKLKWYLKDTLQSANYITGAAPLILDHTLQDLENYIGPTSVVLNSFPIAEFQLPNTDNSNKIKLVWFSQHISFGRGLEELCEIIGHYNDMLELHLYGKMNQLFFDQHLKGINNIFFYAPVEQVTLHKSLEQYDIGVALENSHANLNRDLCLTNKILAYYQAGLYILASDTTAQKSFINNGNDIGVITQLNANFIEKALQTICSKIADIRENKSRRFENAKNISWENESKKILTLLN